MPAFAPVYGDEQRASIACAIVEARQGITCARDAIELAAAGELESVTRPGEKLAAFTMPITTARKLAGEDRKRRAGESVPAWIREKGTDAAIEELAVKLAAIAAHELAAIERVTQPKRDLDRARKAGQILREARALVRGEAPRQGSAQRKARAGDPPSDGSAAAGAAQLVAALRDSRRGDSHGHETDHETETETGTSEAHAPEHEQSETDERGINGRAGSAQARAELAGELGIDPTDLATLDAERD